MNALKQCCFTKVIALFRSNSLVMTGGCERSRESRSTRDLNPKKTTDNFLFAFQPFKTCLISENCLFLFSELIVLSRALVNEDTLLRTRCCRHKCFSVCPRAQNLLRTQKMFQILFRNILCPQQMFPSLPSPRNMMGNDVSATMCLKILHSASTSLQLKIKDAMHILWEQPSLNSQDKHLNLSLSHYLVSFLSLNSLILHPQLFLLVSHFVTLYYLSQNFILFLIVPTPDDG